MPGILPDLPRRTAAGSRIAVLVVGSNLKRHWILSIWEMQWQPLSSREPFKPKWILPVAFKCACLCPLSNVRDVGNVKAQQVACHYRAQDGLTGLDQPHDWITSSSRELCVCVSVCVQYQWENPILIWNAPLYNPLSLWGKDDRMEE